MMEEFSDQSDRGESQDRMENKEDEESVGSSKEDEIGTGSFSATTSEVDEVAAISSVKSDGGEGEEKTFTIESSGSSSETTLSTCDGSPVQSSTLPPSSSRLMRNLAEKMRRDKLNMYIAELSTLVPIVALATKRMDKTSVLRLSANFLRIHLSLKQTKQKENVKFAPEGLESSLSTTLLEALEGFMLIVTASGKIVYVSDSVEKLLGHSQLDLMGQSLYTICHNGDTELLRHHLQPSSEFDTKAREDTTESNESTATALLDYVPRSPSFFGGRPEDALSGLASGERRSFYVRLAERSMARGDPARHVTVHLIGILRPPVNKKDPKTTCKGKKECSSTTTTGTGDEYLLVCVAKPLRNKRITELSLMEAVQDEYVTRHLPDGRIIYSDHRIAFVAGYLTEEVMGLSAFSFIHHDDRPWATVANRQMFSSVEGQGYSVYRLRSKTGSLIHLRTRGFLEFNKTTQKVETFVCINTLLTNEEGDKELEKERDRITPFITYQHVTTTSSTNPSSAGGSSAAQSTVALASSSNALLPALESEVNLILTTTTETTQKSQLIASSTPSGHSSSSCIVELSSDDSRDRDEVSPGTNESTVPLEVQVEVNGVGDFKNSPDNESTNIVSLPSPVQSPNRFPETNPKLEHHHCVQKVVQVKSPPQSVVKSTSTNRSSRIIDSIGKGTLGDLLPRLKRSFPEVEDVFMTSAKRAIVVPTAFISSYSSLQNSPPLSPKWGTETSTTTIIFDQHNNNG